MQCKKRQLRRQIVMAEAEQRDEDARKLRADFAKLDRDPKTAKLERRLAELAAAHHQGRPAGDQPPARGGFLPMRVAR